MKYLQEGTVARNLDMSAQRQKKSPLSSSGSPLSASGYHCARISRVPTDKYKALQQTSSTHAFFHFFSCCSSVLEIQISQNKGVIIKCIGVTILKICIQSRKQMQ